MNWMVRTVMLIISVFICVIFLVILFYVQSNMTIVINQAVNSTPTPPAGSLLSDPGGQIQPLMRNFVVCCWVASLVIVVVQVIAYGLASNQDQFEEYEETDYGRQYPGQGGW